MIVTFVSECEKKALPKTRRVLDAFANRIGQRTWQTVITEQGLLAVKKLLRKTASKNTAVSCHRMGARHVQTELVWIVGNRRKFNEQGIVPVNRTRQDLLKQHLEDDWHYLPLIKALTGLAALFHDWGKSSVLFQEKLQPENNKQFKGDPLRHEWISAVFLKAYVGSDSDEQWLERLAQGEFDVLALKAEALNSAEASAGIRKKTAVLDKMPIAASVLNWLILSHHRLPLKAERKGKSANDLSKFFKKIRQEWGYENKFDEAEFTEQLPRCFEYPNGLPCDSNNWLKEVKKYAKKLQGQLPRLQQAIDNGGVRSILLHSRLSLMLGDHYYSSLDNKKDRLTSKQLQLYANTDKQGELKQTLDEHLLGVKSHAVNIAHKLPLFEAKYEDYLHVKDVRHLNKKSPKGYTWQDDAVAKIKAWRAQQEKLDPHQFGFFAVNMASTGTGKTFANAKIMRALSIDEKSLRYALALGLRTLTLQTGNEYRERIKLKEDELAVLIGSRAILELHEKASQEEKENDEKEAFMNGSESEESLLDNEIYYDTTIPDGNLKTVLRGKKEQSLLYAPVLVCTIDHLMAATETKRGGRYILPTLRLMSSDLVIDEIDDFDGADLIAMGRLIHLAGMLGRKVMISSATIPPDLAQGYFNVYQAGWRIFAKLREKPLSVGCAWIDENKTKVIPVDISDVAQAREHYKGLHNQFVAKRIANLQKAIAKRKACIVPLDITFEVDEQSKCEYFFEQIKKAVIDKHRSHYVTDTQTQKQVSFGVVRMANIDPCVELTQHLLNAQWDEDIDVRVMAYHSQQVLLMRHEQEKHLDEVLKRKDGNKKAACQHSLVQQHLAQSKKQHVIFILVATPVEEVGRDHDFDWAVVEPSSYRSFIQLAGRILRHREGAPETANIALLQYNLKGFLNKTPAFTRPGYETAELPLSTHDLEHLVDTEQLSQCLDATPRITRKEELQPTSSLADLEHESIHQNLTRYDQVWAETMQGWLDSYWWLTANPQEYVRFRESSPTLNLYLLPEEDSGSFAFYERDRKGYFLAVTTERQRGISHNEQLSDLAQERLWLKRDYEHLLDTYDENEKGKRSTAARYGELVFPLYGESNQYSYNSQLGLFKKKIQT